MQEDAPSANPRLGTFIAGPFSVSPRCLGRALGGVMASRLASVGGSCPAQIYHSNIPQAPTAANLNEERCTPGVCGAGQKTPRPLTLTGTTPPTTAGVNNKNNNSLQPAF
jgi:hypothetical protein